VGLATQPGRLGPAPGRRSLGRQRTDRQPRGKGACAGWDPLAPVAACALRRLGPQNPPAGRSPYGMAHHLLGVGAPRGSRPIEHPPTIRLLRYPASAAWAARPGAVEQRFGEACNRL
jgi:hypothetical protein